jgi:hypothetical protein
MDESEKFISLKCIMKYWWPWQNYKTYEIIVNQLIIRCNYADKFSYWIQTYSRENNTCMKEKKWNKSAYAHNVIENYPQVVSKTSLQEQCIDREVLQVSL